MVRLISSLVIGVIVALALFLLMHALISGTGSVDASRDDGQIVDFVRVERESEARRKERQVPKEPPPPDKPPPPPKLEVSDQQKPPPQRLNMITPNIDSPLGTGTGPYLGGYQQGQQAAEGDAIPIFQIRPQFPREALLEGISGWVRMEFTITPTGTVEDVKVVESEPRRLFDRNAVRALLKWKFKPRVIDGQAVSRKARITLDFNLDELEGS